MALVQEPKLALSARPIALTSPLRTERSPAAPCRPRHTTPPAVVVAAVVAAAAATAWSVATHSMLLYGDARAHLDVARRVTDGLRPGLAQLGSVWLPLPHLLMVPLTIFRPLWHTGAAGAIVGGLCFVYGAVRVFSLAEELTGSRRGAWCAFAVFGTNLNVLYVQSTALTEPVLLATFVGAVFHLARWMRTLAFRDLLWAAVFTFAATLTRYEGWALLAAAALTVATWSRLADHRRKATEANVIMFSLIGSYGVVLWVLYNLIIFHDPLYFLHSAYSAQAINGSQAQFGLLGTRGNPKESLLTYAWDVIGACGPTVVVMAIMCTIALLVSRDPQRRRTAFTMAVLFAPVAFEFLSLYVGQTTIRVPERPPHGMWNDRYGLMAVPFCAIVAGAVAGRWRRTVLLAAAAAATATAAVVMALGTPLTIADGRAGTPRGRGQLPPPPLPRR